MPAEVQAAELAACSFCLKPQTEVKRLVAGPGVYICDTCVGLCALLVEDKPAEPGPRQAQVEALRQAQSEALRRAEALRQARSEESEAPVGPLAAWEYATSLDEVLAALPRIASAGAQVERHLTGYVRRARELGGTWARIGEALGMTRQSAWERFSGEE